MQLEYGIKLCAVQERQSSQADLLQAANQLQNAC